jgi:O-methyltransferase involved in polyketide biosynthesis
MAQRAAAVGEPWVSAFDPAQLQKQLLQLGFREAENLDPEVLNRRYLYRRKDGLRTNSRMMCARV